MTPSAPEPDPSPLDDVAFDAVLFDLDGTLVATDRFWVQAARTGARRAFAALGLERELPSAREWMGLVGQPLDVGFAHLFADLPDDQRAHVQAACVEEEHRLLDAGGAAWMPGGEEALAGLVARGVRIGIASNCSHAYLDHMLERLGIGRFATTARCLDSAGIRDKADMIEDQLRVLGTRSAVFVGDRVGDRDAAWANAIPHVHCAFGFAALGEEVAAQAHIEDLGELLPTLARRRGWIASALERTGVFRPACQPPFAVGVTGLPLAGKSLFARDAVAVLRARGIPSAVLDLADWRRAHGGGADGEELHDALDLDRLRADVLTPLSRGEALSVASIRVDAFGVPSDEVTTLEPGGVLFLVGEGLLDARFAGSVERTLWLEVSEEECLRRAAGREGRAVGTAPLEALRGGRLARALRHRSQCPPERLADLCLAAGNPLGAEAGNPLGAGS